MKKIFVTVFFIAILFCCVAISYAKVKSIHNQTEYLTPIVSEWTWAVFEEDCECHDGSDGKIADCTTKHTPYGCQPMPGPIYDGECYSYFASSWLKCVYPNP